MRLFTKQVFVVVLLTAMLLMSSYAVAQEQSPNDQSSGVKQELPAAIPGVGDIEPLSTDLHRRLTVLENTIDYVLDVSVIQTKLNEIEPNLKAPADQLQQLKDSKEYRYKKLAELKQEIEQENELLEEIRKPLSKGIDQLGAWRKEWLAEKKLWNEWQSSLLKEGDLYQLKPTFEKANETIDTALNLVIRKLEEMLTVQQRAGAIQKKINNLAAGLEGQILAKKRGFLLRHARGNDTSWNTHICEA